MNDEQMYFATTGQLEKDMKDDGITAEDALSVARAADSFDDMFSGSDLIWRVAGHNKISLDRAQDRVNEHLGLLLEFGMAVIVGID